MVALRSLQSCAFIFLKKSAFFACDLHTRASLPQSVMLCAGDHGWDEALCALCQKQKAAPEEYIPVGVVGAERLSSRGLHDHVRLHVARGSEVGCLRPSQRPRAPVCRRLLFLRRLASSGWLIPKPRQDRCAPDGQVKTFSGRGECGRTRRGELRRV